MKAHYVTCLIMCTFGCSTRRPLTDDIESAPYVLGVAMEKQNSTTSQRAFLTEDGQVAVPEVGLRFVVPEHWLEESRRGIGNIVLNPETLRECRNSISGTTEDHLAQMVNKSFDIGDCVAQLGETHWGSYAGNIEPYLRVYVISEWSELIERRVYSNSFDDVVEIQRPDRRVCFGRDVERLQHQPTLWKNYARIRLEEVIAHSDYQSKLTVDMRMREIDKQKDSKSVIFIFMCASEQIDIDAFGNAIINTIRWDW